MQKLLYHLSWVFTGFFIIGIFLFEEGYSTDIRDNSSDTDVTGFERMEKLTDNTELDQLRQLFRDGKMLEAKMVHEFMDSYTGESEITEGRIRISKNKYKIIADQQIVVVDGELSRVYNERQNKLVISHYEPLEDDFAPSRFFSDEEEIYHVSDIIRNNNTVTFNLESDDPFEIFLEVRITLDNRLNPIRIYARDQMDNILETTFSESEYRDYDETLFHLEYPDDAEIIDLRK